MATAQELAREGRRESLDPRAARTRAAIIDAAHGLAAEGVHAPSIRQIAERAGVSRSSFYTQFASMTELSIALFEDVLGRITEDDSAARISGTAAAEVLEESVRRMVEDVHALRHLYRMDLPETSAAHLRLVDDVARRLRASRGVGSPVAAGVDGEAAAAYLAGGILSLLRAWITGQVAGTPTQIAAQVMAMTPAWLSADEPDAVSSRPTELRDVSSRPTKPHGPRS